MHQVFIVVRMAERSKAPDSRLIAFSAHNGSGCSGLRMEAWVRIPLLTMYFFCFSICLITFLQVAEGQLEVNAMRIEVSAFMTVKK